MREEKSEMSKQTEDLFVFEKLRVYQRALEFSCGLTKLAVKFPYQYGRLRDQLVGAAISIPLNLAEGSGRGTVKDKRNFFRFSRASVFECIPLLELCKELELMDISQYNSFRKESAEISRIIFSLMKD